MEDTARLARADGWVLSARLVARVKLLFSGFGQEKILEDSLQRCRGVECRNSNQDSIRQWRIWDTPSSAKLVQQYGRVE
eukprot:9599146-Alexandrium_andersonii.AAC.1